MALLIFLGALLAAILVALGWAVQSGRTRWVRPLVRAAVAVLLPALVPGLITVVLWALPGSPAEIICPEEICSGQAQLEEHWNLHQGPWFFFKTWFGAAMNGDFGDSWRMQAGVPVAELLLPSIPTTAKLVGLAFIPMLIGAVLAATRALPKQLDPLLQVVGLAPAVVFALLAAAVVTIKYGQFAFDPEAVRLKLLLGAAVLGLADGALSGTVVGVRGLTEAERNQRYVEIGWLRGERPLANVLPNLLPALAGQMRARLLNILSGAVIVEVILQIDGLGDLIWRGTLKQDFSVVLAAAFGFALLSAALLLLQALVEVVIELHVRRSPSGVSA